MSKPSPYDHNPQELAALAEWAEKAWTNLQAAAVGLAAFAATEEGPKTLHIDESGSIDKSMKIVVKFANDAFDALQAYRTGAVNRGAADKPDTDRPKSNSEGQKSGGNRTRKEKNKMQ